MGKDGEGGRVVRMVGNLEGVEKNFLPHLKQ